jgi:hypothetical protein
VWEEDIMSGQDELERYERTEARDLVRLFEMSRPQGELRAPPDFRLKVLSKIEKNTSRRGVFSWLHVAFTTTWVPALTAALLLLSLGVNVWLGFRDGAPSEMRTVRVLAPAHVFQKEISRDADLGALITAQETDKELQAYGFAGKSTRQKSFLLGALYAEALAYARSGDVEAAVQRWQTMDQALDQTTEPLRSYQHKMQEWLQQEPPALEQFRASLPLFESSFEIYAERDHDQTLPLFQAGAWMTNMRLAAAAGDATGLRQDDAVAYFLARLDAPKGVEDRLDRLGELMAKDTLSQREIRTVVKLVEKMQQLLN